MGAKKKPASRRAPMVKFRYVLLPSEDRLSENIEDKKNHHMMVVGCNIKNKLEEFKYFLNKICIECSLVNENYLAGVDPVNTSSENINFNFSAFVNTIQSLKDGLGYATGEEISWAFFCKDVRHAKFIKECRNAITHDGFNIINLYSDGAYYVASDLQRLDQKDREVVIEVPKVDILTLVIEFSQDLMKKIELIVDDYGEKIPKTSNVDKMEEIKKRFDNPAIPEFAKQLFNQFMPELTLAVSLQMISPVSEIKKEIAKIIEACQNAKA